MSQPVLQNAELGILQIAIANAADRAAQGEIAEGYAILLASVRRAEELASEGEAWANELANRYRMAMSYYTMQYCGAD